MPPTADKMPLLEQLVATHEQERQLVAFDIHDGVIQYLTAAVMQLEAAQQDRAEMSPRAADCFDTALALLRRGIQEARSIIGRIHPPILEEQGIVAAIEYLVAEHHQLGKTKVSFDHDVGDVQLSMLIGTTLFRITQEALMNIRQHSKAKRAHICLNRHDDRLSLKIQDDGIGFDTALRTESQMGLRGVEGRAATVDGSLRVESATGHGTTLIVELPIK